MDARRFALMTLTVTGLALGASGSVHAYEGRYVGSIHHHPGLLQENRMQHLLDLGTRTTVQGGADLQLWLNLTYASEPGTRNTDLLQGRVSADLQKSFWRVRSQVEPWQNTVTGDTSPRKRRLTFGLDLNPRNAPGLEVDWIRTDRDSPTAGLSKTEDKRIRVGYAFRGGSTGLGYRRLDSGSLKPGEDLRHTDEWQADLRKNLAWRRVTLSGSYEGQYTRTAFRERRTKYYVNRFNLGGGWTPHPKVRVGGTATVRAGKNEDNAYPGIRDIDERFFTVRASYMPLRGMDLSALREHRQRDIGLSSDYWQAQARFQREIVRRVNFHAGVIRTEDLGSRPGAAPKSSSFLVLDGRLRRAMAARVEVRAAWEQDVRFVDTQWQRLAQLRLFPDPASRIEVTWRATDDPRLDGVSQEDDSWEILFGYRPAIDLDLTVTYRALDGSGRIDRRERYRSLNSSWNVTPATSVAVNWSRRRTETDMNSRSETVSGAETRFRLPRRWMVRVTFRHLAGDIQSETDSYGLILEKRF